MKIPELQVPPDNPLLTSSGNHVTALKAPILITVKRELSYLTKARVEHRMLFIMYVYLLCLTFLKYWMPFAVHCDCIKKCRFTSLTLKMLSKHKRTHHRKSLWNKQWAHYFSDLLYAVGFQQSLQPSSAQPEPKGIQPKMKGALVKLVQIVIVC